MTYSHYRISSRQVRNNVKIVHNNLNIVSNCIISLNTIFKKI